MFTTSKNSISSVQWNNKLDLFKKLPDDILLMIYMFLTKDDVLRLFYISKNSLALTKDNYFFYKLYSSTSERDLKYFEYKNYKNLYKHYACPIPVDNNHDEKDRQSYTGTSRLNHSGMGHATINAEISALTVALMNKEKYILFSEFIHNNNSYLHMISFKELNNYTLIKAKYITSQTYLKYKSLPQETYGVSNTIKLVEYLNQGLDNCMVSIKPTKWLTIFLKRAIPLSPLHANSLFKRLKYEGETKQSTNRPRWFCC